MKVKHWRVDNSNNNHRSERDLRIVVTHRFKPLIMLSSSDSEQESEQENNNNESYEEYDAGTLFNHKLDVVPVRKKKTTKSKFYL